MTMFKRARGLTLIELMVTLVILSLLSAIAYPLYQNQVRKARRVEAKSTLMELALAEERYLTRVGSYATAVQLATEHTEIIDRMTDRDGTTGPDFYTIAVTPTATSYVVTATAPSSSSQYADTDCRTFTVNQLGQRIATDDGGTDKSDTCW